MPLHGQCLGKSEIMYVRMFPTEQVLLVLVTVVQVKGPIIKPYKQWLCNYCAMGEFK